MFTFVYGSPYLRIISLPWSNSTFTGPLGLIWRWWHPKPLALLIISKSGTSFQNHSLPVCRQVWPLHCFNARLHISPISMRSRCPVCVTTWSWRLALMTRMNYVWTCLGAYFMAIVELKIMVRACGRIHGMSLGGRWPQDSSGNGDSFWKDVQRYWRRLITGDGGGKKSPWFFNAKKLEKSEVQKDLWRCSRGPSGYMCGAERKRNTNLQERIGNVQFNLYKLERFKWDILVSSLPW